MKKHNCDAIAHKTQLLLDGRMTQDEEAALVQEINQCLHCLEMYNLEEKFKAYIKSKVIQKKMASTNLEVIHQKVIQ